MKKVLLIVLLFAVLLSACGPDHIVNEIKEPQNITLVGYAKGMWFYRFVDGDTVCYVLIGHGRDWSAIDCK